MKRSPEEVNALGAKYLELKAEGLKGREIAEKMGLKPTYITFLSTKFKLAGHKQRKSRSEKEFSNDSQIAAAQEDHGEVFTMPEFIKRIEELAAFGKKLMEVQRKKAQELFL